MNQAVRFLLATCVLGAGFAAVAQRPGPGGGPPPLRHHTATTARPLQLVPAVEEPPAFSCPDFRTQGGETLIFANGIPDHFVGRFPNPGNPNRIHEQEIRLGLPAHPRIAESITPLGMGPFGIAVNGVFFDPGAAEFWLGDPQGGWQYEALGGAVPLGLDANHAHVQPNGSYHYHGLPALLLKSLRVEAGHHSPRIGWAADGFPIYALHGHRNPQDAGSPVKTLRSSWRLKPGRRPDPPVGPGGAHDGAFVGDYEFLEGAGDLDECNGRFCVTPEFPEGTYAYFLTTEWPVIPRAFRGSPVPLRPRPGPGGRIGPPGAPGREPGPPQ